MLYVKTKVTNILALNIYNAIIYILFYLFKGFHIVDIYESNILVIILFSLNGIIEQLALYVQNVGSCIKENNQSFNYMWMGVLGTIVAFILMFWMTHSMAGVTLVVYLTYYFLFFKLYSWGKNCEIMLINMNWLVPNEKPEDEILDDNSFNRIIQKENENE